MSENQNNFELNKEELKEIKIEEVERLLALIWENKDVFDYYNFSSLDWDSYSAELYEIEIMDKLKEIESKKEFVEELLSEVRKARWEDIIDNIWNSWASWLSAAIDLFNSFRWKDEIIESFKQNKNHIKNPTLQKYLDYESQRLKSWWEVNDWTFLLMTYIENNLKWMTSSIWESEWLISSFKRNIHNKTQEEYIENILWTNKWYNDYFLQWYNHEVSNYIIKIDDFEAELKDWNKNILSENGVEYQENPNQINSKALWNYILYLSSKWQLNQETLINKLWLKKMWQLYEIWSWDNNSNMTYVARDLLKNEWVFDDINELLSIRDDIVWIWEDIERNNAYINDDNGLDIEYISRNPDIIYSITNTNKLHQVLDLLPEWEKIQLEKINPKIINQFTLDDRVVLWYYWIQEIKKETLDNAIWAIIYKMKNSWEEWNISNLLLRAAYLKVDKNIIKEKIEQYDITIPTNYNYINIYLNENKLYENSSLNLEAVDSVNNNIKFENLLQKYNNFENFEDATELTENLEQHEQVLLTEYILRNLDNPKTQNILVKLISLWYNWANWELIHIPTNNTEVANALVNYRGLNFFVILTNEARWNKEVVDNLLQKIKEESEWNKEEMMNSLKSYYNYINTSDINIFLKVYKFIDENAPWWWLEEMPYEVRIRFMTEKAKNTVANSLWKWLDSNIDADNTQIFLKLINLASHNKYNFQFQDQMREMDRSREQYNSNYERWVNIEEKQLRRESFVDWILEKIDNQNLLSNESEETRLKIIWELENLKSVSENWEIKREDLQKIYMMITSELFCNLEEAQREEKIEEFISLINDEFLSYNAEVIQEAVTNLWMAKMMPNISERIRLIEITDNKWEKKEVIDPESLTNYYREFSAENKDYQWDLKELFIEQNFNELNEEEKQEILYLIERLDLQAEAIDIKNNTDTYISYLRSWEKENFRDYLIDEIWEEEYSNQLKKPFIKNNSPLENNNSKINNYSTETWRVDFINSKWVNTRIELTTTEKQIVESSPEAIDNIINFYNLLNEVWLSKLWNIKDSIFNSIGNVEWIWFNVDWDYLNENEVKIFINKILKSIWIDEIPSILDINNFKWELMNVNNTQFWDSQATNFMYWETYIENLFIEKYYPRWSIHWLLTTNFEENI